jgi:hypothetical protein
MDIEEQKKQLLGGVRFVAEEEVESSASSSARARLSEAARPESWSRTRVAPGVELYLQDDLPRFPAAELRRLMESLERGLRRHGR